jgi:hypothetical protein
VLYADRGEISVKILNRAIIKMEKCADANAITHELTSNSFLINIRI